MNRARQPLLKDIYRQKGMRKARRGDAAVQTSAGSNRQLRDGLSIAPPPPNRLTKREAQRIALNDCLSRLRQNEGAAQSEMTIAGFVESAFVPGHVQVKGLASRVYYRRF